LTLAFKFICFYRLFIVVTMKSFTFVPYFDAPDQDLFLMLD